MPEPFVNELRTNIRDFWNDHDAVGKVLLCAVLLTAVPWFVGAIVVLVAKLLA